MASTSRVEPFQAIARRKSVQRRRLAFAAATNACTAMGDFSQGRKIWRTGDRAPTVCKSSEFQELYPASDAMYGKCEDLTNIQLPTLEELSLSLPYKLPFFQVSHLTKKNTRKRKMSVRLLCQVAEGSRITILYLHRFNSNSMKIVRTCNKSVFYFDNQMYACGFKRVDGTSLSGEALGTEISVGSWLLAVLDDLLGQILVELLVDRADLPGLAVHPSQIWEEVGQVLLPATVNASVIKSLNLTASSLSAELPEDFNVQSPRAGGFTFSILGPQSGLGGEMEEREGGSGGSLLEDLLEIIKNIQSHAHKYFLKVQENTYHLQRPEKNHATRNIIPAWELYVDINTTLTPISITAVYQFLGN
ncbi:hypothetical protein SELMODRAFT_413023 [Selaginella moellendorffii]|uniref:Uncharacterized protein n=1 Tax=Selaginella moellendorffii TaxID=88036 RepID=D8RN37_SELML|nr:hypothetical protein SELMODRAFT_413023 [Selaginella moellendorffii]